MGKSSLVFICVALCIASAVHDSKGQKCPPYALPCDDGECILRQEWCDKTPNCGDKSDEKYCRTAGWINKNPNYCEEIHFLCSSGPCIPKDGKCDGLADCSDGSDEEECFETTSAVSYSSEDDGNHQLSTPSQVDVFNGNFDEDVFDSSEEIYETSSTVHETTDSSRNWGWRSTTEAGLLSGRTTQSQKHAHPNRGQDGVHHPDNYEDNPNKPFSGHQKPNGDASFTGGRDNGEENSHWRGVWNSQSRYDAFGKDIKHEAVHPHEPVVLFRGHTQSPDPHSYQPPNPRYPYYINGHRQYWPSSLPEGCIPTFPSHTQNPMPPTRPATPSTRRIQPPTTRRTQPPTSRSTLSPTRRSTVPATHSTTTTSAPPPPTRRTFIRKYPIYSRKKQDLPPFYFQRNYTSQFGNTYNINVLRGQKWFLEQHNLFWGWGEDTARVLIALSLANNSFVSRITKNDAMKKQFQVHLGVHLLRNGSKPITLSRLAIYVNAMFATCQNPRNFQGHDLVQTLLDRKAAAENSGQFVNPIVFIALCLADHAFALADLEPMIQLLTPVYEDEWSKDMQSLATTALACYLHHSSLSYNDKRRLRENVDRALNSLLERKLPNGGFGSIYSTALVAQALLSVNTSVSWDPHSTLNFLVRHQTSDGCFGNLLSTYYILPVLRGRSLLHLRNTRCDPPIWGTVLTPQEILDFPGQKYYVYYSLYFGNPMERSYTVTANLPLGINFFDVMRVAEYLDNHFNFSYEEENGNTYVYAISDIPNDSERGFYWHLYVTEYPQNGNRPGGNRLYTGDISLLLPKPSEHIIFWYHRDP